MRARRGNAPAATLMAISIAALVGLTLALRALSRADATGLAPIELYCAAGVRPPVAGAVRRFTEETGQPVRIQYGGSGALLAAIQLSGRGDLYIAADDSYVRTAEDRGLIFTSVPLATLTPVIAVPAGNAKNVRTLDDLLRKDVTFAMANPSVAAVGQVTKEVLQAHGLWAQLAERCRVFKPTVNEIAADVRLGTVDAAIIWDATAAQTNGIEAVSVPQFENIVRTIEAGVLASSTQPEAALELARYLAASDRGGTWFDQLGYGPIERQPWRPDRPADGGGP
ncbi:MAG: molybdate ABC transporter substrate-binding protein [Planctomycetes bacterium]|nr:molybdate ABC transporter substrate-binding protein [Planctomycetota bacterium]